MEKKSDLVTEDALYRERQNDPLRIKLRNAVDKDRRIIYGK